MLPGDDAELLAAFRDLGGHDLAALIDGFQAADAVRDRPSVVFAYTIKGWRLPTEGHPANHSALLSRRAVRRAGGRARHRSRRPVGGLRRPARPRPSCARRRRARLRPRAAGVVAAPPRGAGDARPRAPRPRVHPAGVRALLGRPRARGARRSRSASSPSRPTSARRPTSAAGSTRRASGRSATGSTGSPTTPTRSCAGARPTTASTSSSASPRSTSSACSASSGATWSRDGQPLLPVGTIYDPFVARALEPWSFGIYAGGQSILVGTPSGVTLGPEGGAHQSVITPSIGIEQPGCVAWEPAFGRDFEWTFLHALSRLGRPDGGSAYFRLSHAADRPGAGRRCDRASTCSRAATGCARARRVVIAAMGALVPEAIEAAEELGRRRRLHHQRRPAVPRLPGPRRASATATRAILDELFRRAAPIVSLLDGHPHTLSFLGGVHGVPIACLGVQRFGQSGDIGELYEHHQIDAESVVGAALDLLERRASTSPSRAAGSSGWRPPARWRWRDAASSCSSASRALGAHQTTHNSGVIHAGHLLRARLAEGAAVRRGRRRLYDYCAEHGIAAERCGKLVVAVRDADLPRLDELERRGARQRRAGPGAARRRTRSRAVEPAARGLSALHSPNTGMVDFGARRRRLRARHRGARRRDPPRRRRARADRARGPRRAPCCADGTVVPAAARRRLRRRVVGPAGAGLGRAAGRAHRPVPRRLPAAAPGARATSSAARSTRCPTRRCRSSACTSRARSAASVLIGPTALLAARDATRTCARRLGTLRWPGTWRVMRALVADRRHASSPTPRARAGSMREAARFVPGLGKGDVTAGPRGYRAQARRPRRRAGRRLPRRRDRARRARAQRAVARPRPRRWRSRT